MLSPEQQIRIVEALAEKGITTLTCPACGHTKSEVAPDIHAMMAVERQEDGWNTVQRGALFVVIGCSRCGFAWQFGIHTLGLGGYFGWPGLEDPT